MSDCIGNSSSEWYNCATLIVVRNLCVLHSGEYNRNGFLSFFLLTAAASVSKQHPTNNLLLDEVRFFVSFFVFSACPYFPTSASVINTLSIIKGYHPPAVVTTL